MGSWRLFISFCLILSLQVSRGEELSIEDIIQRNVVEACDKINKPRSTCQTPKELKPVDISDQAPLNRCDRAREDVPASDTMTSYSEKTFPVSRLSVSEVQEVFSYVSKQKSRYSLNEGWAATGVCAARSHLIADDIQKDCKVSSGKVFVSPSRSAATLWLGNNSLFVEAKGRKFRWDSFHVANMVLVEKNGKSETYVIDPLLFDKAVPLREWETLVKSQDPSASSWITSSKAFGQSDRHVDSPSNPMNLQRAQEIMERAKRDERTLSKSRP